MQKDNLKNETPTDANNMLADSASFWMNADKSTVQKYLKENVEDMDEYNRKKKEIMKRCFERAKQRFEKPNFKWRNDRFTGKDNFKKTRWTLGNDIFCNE